MTVNTDLTTIIATAEETAAVVAIGTEGSTNDTAVTPDQWADLDVTIFLTAAVDAWSWVCRLGQPVIYQHLHNDHLFGPASADWDTWLVRYAGTRRIDWKFAPAADIDAYLASDQLNAIVWRKGVGRVSPRVTSALSHAVSVPDQAAFAACLNELLWCAGNVAKGLHRGQLLYANEMLDTVVRPELLRLLRWQAVATRPHFNAGAYDKFLQAALTPVQEAQLRATYRQSTLAETTASLQATLTLSLPVATALCAAFDLRLPDEVAGAMDQLSGWLD